MGSIAYKNDNSAYLHFLFISLDPYLVFFFFCFPEHNSATFRNILIVLCMIIEQDNARMTTLVIFVF